MDPRLNFLYSRIARQLPFAWIPPGGPETEARVWVHPRNASEFGRDAGHDQRPRRAYPEPDAAASTAVEERVGPAPGKAAPVALEERIRAAYLRVTGGALNQ
jgi:hypothetical protein